MAVLGSFLVWSVLGCITWLFASVLGNGVSRMFGGNPKGIGCGTVLFGLIFAPFILIFGVIGSLLKKY